MRLINSFVFKVFLFSLFVQYSYAADYFTIGSTKDEVLEVMGTPADIRDYTYFEVWGYGLSNVTFDNNGRVKSYANSGGNLKITMNRKPTPNQNITSEPSQKHPPYKTAPVSIPKKQTGQDIATQSKPKLPPRLTVNSIKFIDTDGNNFLDGEEKGTVVVTVVNKGQGEAYNVIAELTPKINKIDEPTESVNLRIKKIKIGLINPVNISPGKEVKIELPVTADKTISSGKVSYLVQAKETNGFDSDPVKISFETRQFYPPKLSISDIGIKEIAVVGERNNKIDLGEAIEVKTIVKNKGKGKAKNVKVKIAVDDLNIYLTSDTDFNLGNLAENEWKEIVFSFNITNRYSSGEILPIFAVINEERKEFSKKENLKLTLGKSVKEISEITFKGNEETKPVRPVPVLTVDIEKTIPETKTKNLDAVAVIIGIRNYKNKDVPSVEYALNDAHLVKEYLIKLLGYREGNIIYLENPTKGDFERVFGSGKSHKGELFNYVKANKSDVFVYYVGHGAPDLETKGAYFVPADCHPNFVSLNGYSLDLFYDNLSKISAKNTTVVIDACFSGGSEKGMLIAKASPLVVTPAKGKVAGNINLFTSSSGDEISSWYPEKQHGLFTYFFLKALQGDADKDKNKELTFGEIKSYLDENIPYQARRMYGRTQTPSFIGNESKIMVKY